MNLKYKHPRKISQAFRFNQKLKVHYDLKLKIYSKPILFNSIAIRHESYLTAPILSSENNWLSRIDIKYKTSWISILKESLNKLRTVKIIAFESLGVIFVKEPQL